MKRFLSALLSAVLVISGCPFFVTNAFASETSTMSVVGLKTEHMTNPIGIDDTNPLFSWKLNDTITRGQVQTSYRIRVAKSESDLENDTNLLWDSGEVDSDNTVDIKYQGDSLEPSTRYFWNVEVCDKDSNSVFSENNFFETGLMDSGWSGAQWIGRSEPVGGYFDLSTFSVDFDFRVVNEAFSFLFGATDSANFYMWQVSTFDWHSDFRLRPHKRTNGSFSELAGATLLSDKTTANETHHMKIEADNGSVKTYLDGSLKDTRTLDGLVLGYIGFRCSGNEQFNVDNIVVKDGSGNTILSAGFDGGDTKGFPSAVYANNQLEFSSSKVSEISLRTTSESKTESTPMFRHDFSLDSDKMVDFARLYITSTGLYDAYINGKRVTDSYLNPGMTQYDDHIMYQTFDVTSLLENGDNAIGAYVGEGWFNGSLRGFGTKNCLYAKLFVKYTDGSSDVIVTDNNWKFYRYGPVLEDSIFNGYKYDATIEKAIDGWNKPGYDSTNWDSVSVTDISKLMNSGTTAEIIAQNIPLIKNTITLSPVAEPTEPEPGVYVYDFGQNIAGIVRVTASASEGTTMTLRHAEMLNLENMTGADGDPGTIFTANLPRADATDTYVFRGDNGEETFEPQFTYHGFRYLEISGLEEPIPVENVKALLLMSDLEQTSSFYCSDALVNRLYQNALWSARDNFMSVPTDCPQRGERFGWTGDAQIFARAGSYLMDINAFYQKYCMDMRDTSNGNRIIADVAPASAGSGWYGSGDRKEATNGWGDAIVIIPYEMYKQYGNVEILEENYTIMCNWMDYLVSTSENYIRDESWTGDWLAVNEPKSPIAVTDTAFCAYSAMLLSEISEILGKSDKAAEYNTIYNNYRNAWRSNFLEGGEGGKTKCNTQTSYVLGIKFKLFDEDEIAQAANNLVRNIKSWDWHLTTGFLGLSYLNPVLSDTGYSDAAYKLLEQKQFPSWLYSVTTGSTTIWESWTAFRLFEDGSSQMSEESLNHFSYGAVVEWLQRYMLGIDRDENIPAFKKFVLKPEFGGSFTFANGSYNSIRGTIESGWTLDKDTGDFTYNATVPANTIATLYLPVTSAESEVFEGGVYAADAEGVTFIKNQDGKNVYELESGIYTFTTSANLEANEITSVYVGNKQHIDSTVTINDVSSTEYPQTAIFPAQEAKVTVTSNDSSYKVAYLQADDGTKYDNGHLFTGDVKLNAVFSYTGEDDTVDGDKTITITGDAGVSVSVNGTSFALPYTGTFAKGELIQLTASGFANGFEFDSIGDIVALDGTTYISPVCNLTLNVNKREIRNRDGYDVFFDFKDNIVGWAGGNVALNHVEDDYLQFMSVAKSDGSYDPRADYDFTASSATATGGDYLKASDYTELVIGYIANEVGADSTPVMYIATEAQPSYTNPVRSRSATSKILASYADGKTLREVTFKLSDWSEWKGNISRIFLDVLDNVSGTLKIDYIKFKHRPFKLTVKKNASDDGTVYEYLPKTIVDLTKLETSYSFLGYSMTEGSTDYITSLELTDDTVIYANYPENYTLPAPIEWNFNDNTAQGWTTECADNVAVINGVLKADFSAAEYDFKLLRNGLSIDASIYSFAEFKLRHNIPDGSFGEKPFEVFFRNAATTWLQHYSVNTAQRSATSDFDSYVFDMKNCANWNGSINSFRVDPFEIVSPSGSSYTLEVDSIRLSAPAAITVFDGYTDTSFASVTVPSYTDFKLSDYLTQPTRENYTFAGWKDKDGNVYAADGNANFKNAFNELTALWNVPEAVKWTFDNNDAQNWSAQNGDNFKIENDIMKADIMTSNADFWFKNYNLSFSADTQRFIVVKMRHNIPDGSFGSKKFQVFFVRTTDYPWSEALMAQTSQRSTTADMDTYIIDMKNCSNWNGSIKNLRIDPFEITSTADRTYTIEVDGIYACAPAALTLDPANSSAVQSYTVPAGVEISISTYLKPEKQGYELIGWTDGKNIYTDDITINAEFTTLTAVWKEITEYVWDFDDNTTQGWNVSNSKSYSVTNGVLRAEFSTTNNDLIIDNGSLNIDSSKFKYVELKMRHNISDLSLSADPIKAYFGGSIEEHKKATIDALPMGEYFDTVTIDMTTSSYWSGTITKIRIDPLQLYSTNDTTYYVELDSIRVLTKPDASPQIMSQTLRLESQSDKPFGIRNLAEVKPEILEKATEYGFIISRPELLREDQNLTFESLKGTDTYVSGTCFDDTMSKPIVWGISGESLIISGVLTGIEEKYYDKQLIVRAYAVVDGINIYGDIKTITVKQAAQNMLDQSDLDESVRLELEAIVG